MTDLALKQHEATTDLERFADQPQCRLLSLPAELRNHIWRHLLFLPPPSVPVGPSAGVNARLDGRVCANILQACRQLNAECAPVLYGENLFSAHNSLLSALPAFLRYHTPYRAMLPPVLHGRVARLIRRYYMYLRLDVDLRFTQHDVEESFTGLEELQIEAFQSMFGAYDWSNLKLFEGVRGVRKAAVYGSVGDGKYATWLARTMESAIGDEPEPFQG